MPQPDDPERARRRKLIQGIVGENVRQHRTKQDMSRVQLSKLCGSVHESYVRQIENGQKEISLVRLVEFADALGVNASELLDGV
jgi:transcriptional regulator with XRE-family HTH domain